MSNPLPAVPQWFSVVAREWKAMETWSGINGCTQRKKQLERLKQSHGIEMSCRTGNPGRHYLMARLTKEEE